MANHNDLKTDIRQYIYSNQNEEITGNILRDVLLEMVDTLGDGWTYKGVATTTANPGTPDSNVFYIATAPGTYTNFKNSSNVALEVADGEVAILKYNGSWAKDVTGAATSAQVTQLGQEVDMELGILTRDVITQPNTEYVSNSMVSVGDTLTIELESLNNTTSYLYASKIGGATDKMLYVDAGSTKTWVYTIPQDFFKIYTPSGAPSCKIVKITTQKSIPGILDSIDSINSEISNIGQEVADQLNTPTILQLASAGWTSYEDFTTTNGVAFKVSNSGPGKISYVSLVNENGVQLQEISVSILSGESAILTPTVSGAKVRIFANNACVARFYNDSTLLGRVMALEKKTVKDEDILQASGTATDKIMSQGAVTKLADSPFAVVVPDALKGIVAFRMNNVAGNNMPIDDYTSWRIASIYTGGTWNLYLALQKSVDGVNWTPFDSVERAASAAPSPLPVIEEITSKYGGFNVIINWPLMGNVSASGVSYILKKDAPNYFSRELQEQIDNIKRWPSYGDYEGKDRIAHIIKVDAGGNGDYTTIAAAYAAITDSAYNNQYEVIIYPGTYNEYNLVPPAFTHTHGLIPDTVIVTSEGATGTAPVFDQKYISKLSFMKIISGTGYCVHQDYSSLAGVMLVNENLHCKKVYGNTDVSNFKFRSQTNPSVLGIGSHFYGAKFVWKNCTFENGEVASHTVGSSDTTPGNQHIIYKNCKLVNAYIWLGVTGTSAKVGEFVCEIEGLHTEKGRASLVCVPGARSTGDVTYNFPWQVIGGNNKNFSPMWRDNNDTTIDDVWPSINTNEMIQVQLASGVSVEKGQWVDMTGNICDGNTPAYNIIGVAVEDANAGGTVRVWTGDYPMNNNFVLYKFPFTNIDGEYGIGSDGKLSISAPNKIGRVLYNLFRLNK